MTMTMQSEITSMPAMRSIPPGYWMRPATMADVEETVQLMNHWSRQAIGREKFTLEEVRGEWQEPGYDLESDSRVVISPEGRIVGYQEVFDHGHPHIRFHCWGVIAPELSGMGLESELLNWAEDRARELTLAAPPHARIVLVGTCLSTKKLNCEIFQRSGFVFQRQFLRMVVELDGLKPAPQWPEGITVREMIPGREERIVFSVMREAFKDHWGFVEVPFEEEYARFEHFIHNKPDFDPSLWFVAEEGEQIAGIALCYRKARDDDEMGWVGTLGVRRPWRRRGLALALLLHSFAEFQRRGKRTVGLGVDSQSLTGAMRLYEKAGMHSDATREINVYEKELRPGEELSTQTVEL